MTKEEIQEYVEQLKDDTVFVAADRVVTRVKNYHEIEDLTMFPVSGIDKAVRLDQYTADVLADKTIEDRKRVIGTALMQTAWAEDLKQICGWKILAEKMPNATITGMYRNMPCYPKITGDGILFTDRETNPVTVNIISDNLKGSGTIHYVYDGNTISLNKVMILTPGSVILILE